MPVKSNVPLKGSIQPARVRGDNHPNKRGPGKVPANVRPYPASGGQRTPMVPRPSMSNPPIPQEVVAMRERQRQPKSMRVARGK